MYTLCSHCQTAQEVTREMLIPTRGELPCSHCGRHFDALENISRDPPPGYPIARRRKITEDIQPSLFAAPTAHAEEAPAPSVPPPPPPPRPHEPPPSAAPLAERTDPIADVLAAHADFIEPPAIGGDADPEARVDAAAPASLEPAAPVDEPATATPSAPAEGGDDALATAALATDHADPTAKLPSPHAIVPRDEAVIDLREALEMTLGAPAPSFIPSVSTPRALPVTRRWPGILAVVALLLLLGTQSLIAERHALAADARWRPWLERACGTLGCTLPPWREPAAMHILTRDVRPHPSMPEALIISASFRNDARWPQPWPRLDLTLSDINGQPIARRRFTSEKYLGHLQSAPLIQPGQSASIALEVRDPGKQAVAFEFDLL
jgi:hypothetical protein